MTMILTMRLEQRTVLGAGMALALLACFLFAYSLWRWYNDWELAHQSLSVPPALTATDETARLIAAIPDNHLFGQAFSKTGEVPLSDLQLRVTGIVKVTNESSSAVSKAYISISGQPSKIYQAGDSLPFGVKVYDITSDSVILENGGRLEKLPLPREKLEFHPAAIWEEL